MKMDVDQNPDHSSPEVWSHLLKILTRRGPFAHPSFEASDSTLTFLQVCLCPSFSF